MGVIQQSITGGLEILKEAGRLTRDFRIKELHTGEFSGFAFSLSHTLNLELEKTANWNHQLQALKINSKALRKACSL